jgi:hypothetical protein
MKLQDALNYADSDKAGLIVRELQEQRQAIKVLSTNVRKYRLWILDVGGRHNICTFKILGEVCPDCKCSHKR